MEGGGDRAEPAAAASSQCDKKSAQTITQARQGVEAGREAGVTLRHWWNPNPV